MSPNPAMSNVNSIKDLHSNYIHGVSFGGREASKKRIENAILIGLPLMGSFLCPFWFLHHRISYIEMSAFLMSYIVVGVGVGVGLHRYFSHKSFKPRYSLEIFLGVAGSMAFQGSILRWVADHRRHHASTDHCGDLHSPNIDAHCSDTSSLGGLFHAHVGWMFDDSVTMHSVFAKDLLKNPVVMFFHRTHWVWPSLLLGAVSAYGFILGGLESAVGCLLFAGCLRTSIFHNIVWAVNSIGHSHGYQSYEQDNNSRNNTVLAWLTFGEGWHNNHHKFPRSAYHGLTRREIDINGQIIGLFERFGWASDVVRVPVSHRSV